jgi:Alpha/beta hydrolase
VTVSVADIERWKPGDVREVFHATRSRAEATFEAADGIATLPAFGSWHGQAAEAAKNANERLRRDLDVHGNEAWAVAKAARTAADDMERVKADLARVEADATEEGFGIDPVSSRVLPGPNPKVPMIIAVAEMEALQTRLDAVLADAARVDGELAQAIDMATGAAPIPDTPHDNRPEIQVPLSRPLPTDPRQFHDLWQQLTQEEKDWLYRQNHSIGNDGGMPFVDRDIYNRMHLTELLQTNQTEIDRLRAAHPDWAAGRTPMFDSPEWQRWKPQWDAANQSQQGYEQVQRALRSPDGLPRLLGTLDDRGHAALSINNPDTAKRNATFVPATGQDLTRLEFSTSKSEQMLQATLRADPSLRPNDVSVTTWMGYDRPMDVITEAPSTSYAHNGAQALDDFQAGLRASHDDALVGGTSINTVIGHSYGSTLVGAAELDGHHLDANNVVAVGSPGILAQHATDLNLDPGARVFATRAENDIIGIATYATLGPDPMSSRFGGIPFEAAPGRAGPFDTPTIAAHSSYWDAGNPALDNIGRIIDGQATVTPPRFAP